MKASLVATILALLITLAPVIGFAGQMPEKNHDFLPKVHNLIFVMDVSDSMLSGYPQTFNFSRLFIASRGLARFNAVMPHVPHWQYDRNTALITFGDCATPKLLSQVGPWARTKFAPYYNCMRQEGFGPYRTATLQDALQLAGQLIGTLVGRTAIVIFSDGSTQAECPQKTVTAMKDLYGDKVVIYAIYLGDREVGWRNLYEICKLSGGYARRWEDVSTKPELKAFVWDITGKEIMFPYPEVFFRAGSSDLLPSEALKLESVANFLRAIPQYMLQIDGHTSFLGNTAGNHKLAMARAESVKKALVKVYGIHPERLLVRSFGEELPRYDNQHPDMRYKNNQANLYLKLPLRNAPYDEKRLHTFGVNAVGDVYNTQERDSDTEWAWPDKPVSDTTLPVRSGR